MWIPLLLVAAALIGAMAISATRLAGPSDATMVSLSSQLPQPVLRIETVLDGGSELRSGDVVVAMDGVPVDRGDLLRRRRLAVGDVVTYTVQRSGKLLQVPVRLTAWPEAEWAHRNWSTVALMISLLPLAVEVFRRQPADPAARTLLVLAAFSTVGVLASVLGGQVVDIATGRDLVWLAAGEACTAGIWVTWLLFTLVFPQAVSGFRIRQLVIACTAVFVVVYGGYLLAVVPSAPNTMVAQWRAVTVSLAPDYVFPELIVALTAVRFWPRRHTRAARYLGWLLVTFAFSVLLFYSLWKLPAAIRGGPLLDGALMPLAFVPCPLVLAAAVLRFGLFDVKAVAGRSLVYALLTIGVVGGYVGLVAVLGSLMSTGTLLAPSLLATVVLAVLFQPVKDQLQRAVSRLLYGSRDEPYQALSRLGQQLESAVAAPAVLRTIAGTVGSALRLSYAAVELYASNGTLLRRAEIGSPPGNCHVRLPAVAGGELIGQLFIAPRPPATEFAESELRLLTDLARQAAPTLQALRLTVELEQSRQGLLRARAEERRRLQRDLHDGIGPSLAGLTLQIGAARALLTAGNHRQAADRLVNIERQLADCAADVRQLLSALRSPLLDSLGFLGALHYQAERLSAAGRPNITITTPPDLPGLPAAVEEASLAIVSEAMTNVARHADAPHCDVNITIMNSALQILVVDDGCGFPAGAPSGIGLPSMRRRAAELGGSCRIGPHPAAGGTRVQVSLPLTQP